MADYLGDYESALESLKEDGALATVSWEDVANNDTDGSSVDSGDFFFDVYVIILPIPTRGRTFAEQLTFRNKKQFYAVPLSQASVMKEQYKLTVGGITYEIETCDPLAPDGTVNILFQGTLRLGT